MFLYQIVNTHCSNQTQTENIKNTLCLLASLFKKVGKLEKGDQESTVVMRKAVNGFHSNAKLVFLWCKCVLLIANGVQSSFWTTTVVWKIGCRFCAFCARKTVKVYLYTYLFILAKWKKRHSTFNNTSAQATYHITMHIQQNSVMFTALTS